MQARGAVAYLFNQQQIGSHSSVLSNLRRRIDLLVEDKISEDQIEKKELFF